MDMSSHSFRANRVVTAIEATLVEADGTPMSVEIADLSSGGFRLVAPKVLAIGDRVLLKVAHYGDFAGHIRWVAGYQAGGQFDHPVKLT